jgi:hypothetical protein
MATVKKTVKKAQPGKKVKPTADSTAYFTKKATRDVQDATKIIREKGPSSKEYGEAFTKEMQSLKSIRRQSKKGKPGYDANGFPINKQKSGGKTMLKRADGSTSQRGLWDNLRSKAAQNKKTGAKPKAPSKAMLAQEKKIKAKGK